MTVDQGPIADGRYTITSRKGGHRTLRVKTIRSGRMANLRVVGLLFTGPDNEGSYFDFAFVNSDCLVVWKKRRGDFRGMVNGETFVGTNYPIYTKFAKLLWSLASDDGEARDAGYEMLVEKTCRRCGRTLTTPESIEAGIGPECKRKGRQA